MNKKVKVDLPVNLSAEDSNLFLPYKSYKFPFLKVRELKKIFITSSGLACNRIGLLKDCCHRFDFEDNHERMMNEVARHYHAVNDDPEKLTVFDDNETYLLIHHPWQSNYYHWICEGLLRLWMVRERTEDLILLLPDIYRSLPFLQDSLEVFKFKGIRYIEPGKSILVRNLCMPQMKPSMDSYVPVALTCLREMYVDYSKNVRALNLDKGERIYLSRNKSGRRKISNEKEVVQLMLKYNFKVINNEDYSFFEQVALYSKIKYLVTIHGAGLTNILYIPEGAKVLELHKRQTNKKDFHSLIYWYMADALGQKYFHQICEPTDPEEDFFRVDLIADIDQLEKNLQLMLLN